MRKLIRILFICITISLLSSISSFADTTWSQSGSTIFIKGSGTFSANKPWGNTYLSAVYVGPGVTLGTGVFSGMSYDNVKNITIYKGDDTSKVYSSYMYYYDEHGTRKCGKPYPCQGPAGGTSCQDCEWVYSHKYFYPTVTTCSHGSVAYSHVSGTHSHTATCNYCGLSWTEDCTGSVCSKCGYAYTSYLTFNTNGGTGGQASGNYQIGSTLNLTSPTRANCTFMGWSTNSSATTGATSITVPTSNTTYYAIWSAYIDLNGSINGTSQGNTSPAGTADVYINGTCVADDVTDYYSLNHVGYTWEIKGVKANTGYSYIGNSSYSGTISGNTGATLPFATTYTVSYNGNGATSGSTASSSHIYTQEKKLTANGFVKTGYTFAGWATSAGGAVAYSDAQSVKNLTSTAGGSVTLYAKWTPNTNTAYKVRHWKQTLTGE